MITLEDLMEMSNRDLHAIVERAHPLNLTAMANTQYLGVDLSLPGVVQKLLWKTFRKTFHFDPALGVLRGWNVKMEQTGVRGPAVPLTDHNGRQITFGHYRVQSAEGVRFPRGWQGPHFLNYTVAGNRFTDAGRFGFTPLVAVNEGQHDLLLGWEVMKVGGLFLPIPDYWALELQGPLTDIEPVPRPD